MKGALLKRSCFTQKMFNIVTYIPDTFEIEYSSSDERSHILFITF